jgi:hypothetical protein
MSQFNQNNQNSTPSNGQAKQPAQNQTTIKAPVDKQSIISSHEKAAEHHTEAAKYHSEAAGHHKDGNYEKGYAVAQVAAGHTVYAKEEAKKACKQGTGAVYSNDKLKQ